eukprot:COSAG01_NODE_9838_length_2326_cov_73.564885_2_plen_189_part_00
MVRAPRLFCKPPPPILAKGGGAEIQALSNCRPGTKWAHSRYEPTRVLLKISGGHSRLRIIAGARAGQFFQQDFSQNQQNFDLSGCSIDQQIDSQKDSSVNQQNFGLPGCWIDQQIDLQKYADFSGILAAGQQISQFVRRSENNIALLDLAAVAVGTRSSTCFQQMGASTLAAQNPRRTTYMARPINRE